MGAAGLAPGQALVDAIAAPLIGDDEDTAVGGRGRGGGDENTGQNRGNGSHAAPVNEGSARNCPDRDKPKSLRMINHAGGVVSRPKPAFLRPLTQSPPLAHGRTMNGSLAICGICREIMS